MDELLLLVVINGDRVAIRASLIQSVIDLGKITPVPRCAPHVAGLAALRSQPLTVIDCAISLELREERSDGKRAVVVKDKGHHYALLVDAVEDVTESLSEPAEITTALKKGWRRAAQGMVETDGGPVLLVEIPAIIEGPYGMEKPTERAVA